MDQDLTFFRKWKSRRAVIRWVVAILVVIAFLALLWFALDRWFFRVRNVTVSASKLYTEEELIAAIPVENGERLFSVDKKAVKSAIEENFPFLTQIEVHLSLPHTVKITFVEKMGEVALTLGSETYAVDADLTVLARISPEDAASRLGLTAEGVSRCIVGEKIEFLDPSVPEILSDVVTALDEAEMLGSVKSLDLRDKFNLRMDYGGKFDIKLGENVDMDLKLAMIKRVMAEMTSEDTGEIDISDPNNAYVRLVNRNTEPETEPETAS